MKQKEKEIIIRYMERMFPAILLILIAVCLSEVFFSIRAIGFLRKADFNNLSYRDIKTILYLVSYIFLILVASFSAFSLFLYIKKKVNKDLLYVANYICAIGFIIWGAFISILDSTSSELIYDSNRIIVYLTVIMAISALAIVHPIVYNITITITTIVILLSIYMLSGSKLSFSLYGNLIIFILSSSAVNYVVYKLHLKNYESNLKLSSLSYHDQLTNLLNRRALFEELEKIILKGEVFTFLIIDVDDFKMVNDTYGHLVGDNAIELISKELISSFHERVYRYGGDEFAVISKHNDTKDVEIINSINKKLQNNDLNVPLHISCGVYNCVSDTDIKSIIHNADTALYESKNGGKSCCTVFGK